MWLRVDPRSEVPLYQQLVDQVREGVARGWLQPGDRLPSVRELAVQLALNHNTVAKAYQELEREGLIETLRGRGTFVALPKRRRATPEDYAWVESQIRQLLVAAYHLGIEPEELADIVRRVAAGWRKTEGGSS
ncbi:MAG: GntR family transcriptional regulator [Alicyclobacillaceae bacterium]|nr:GntR family transcriptional regulator [Alicyclobacillaceae bacterium]